MDLRRARPRQLRGDRALRLDRRLAFLGPGADQPGGDRAVRRGRFGGGGADAARGVSVRADNGPQYIARLFTEQVKHWGMAMSYAYPYQPECNGVAERFFRTLKEQTIFGRMFRTAPEVRAAVAAFVECYNAFWRYNAFWCYNAFWRLERLGYQSPLAYRTRYEARQRAAA